MKKNIIPPTIASDAAGNLPYILKSYLTASVGGISVAEALIRVLIEKALDGDLRSIDLLFELSVGKKATNSGPIQTSGDLGQLSTETLNQILSLMGQKK